MSRVSPSMAVALVALFVALGGSGYAAVRVNGRSLVDRSIAGSKLKHNTLTGTQIDESRLGRVPSAADSDFLDGRPAGAYVLADGGTAATAKEALLLDGMSASAFLPAGGTAVNAGALGGQPASAFLGAGATAVNATALQGRPASDFVPAGKVQGAMSLAVGADTTLLSSGPLTVVAHCAGGPQAEVLLRHTVDVLDPTAAASADTVPAGVDAPLATATFAAGHAATVARVPFTALAPGAGIQGVATAIATSTGCEAAAFGVTS